MTHANSLKSYRDLPPDSVMEVAREIIQLQCAGYEPTANVIGRMIGKPASSVTGRIGDIRHPEKGNGCVVVDGVLYRLFEAGNTINPVTKRPNAIWQLIPEQPAAPVKLPDNGVQIQMPL